MTIPDDINDNAINDDVIMSSAALGSGLNVGKYR